MLAQNFGNVSEKRQLEILKTENERLSSEVEELKDALFEVIELVMGGENNG